MGITLSFAHVLTTTEIGNYALFQEFSFAFVAPRFLHFNVQS